MNPQVSAYWKASSMWNLEYLEHELSSAFILDFFLDCFSLDVICILLL